MKASVSATSLYDLTPGTRVVVRTGGHLSGQTGVVVEMAEKLLNGHDCAVLLDYDDEADLDDGERAGWPLCFFAHELAVEK